MVGTADDFKAASAKDAVEETAVDRGEVDFEWVMRAFLSYYFPINHGWKGESDILLAVYKPLSFSNCLGNLSAGVVDFSATC